MVKKLFGLASVTVLTGLVVAVSAAGCSSKVFIYDNEGGLEGGLRPGDPGYVPPSEAGKGPAKHPVEEEDASTSGSCPTTSPITASDIDAQLQWKAPASFQNVCSQQNINDLKALFKSGGGAGVKFTDIKAALGASCAACAFSPIAGATWQVFVEDASGAIDNRTGSCFAQRSGASCGQARFRFEACLDAACSIDDCGSESSVQACTQKAQKGACKDLTAAYAQACPNETTDLPPCGNIFGSIATSCSGGPSNTIDITP